MRRKEEFSGRAPFANPAHQMLKRFHTPPNSDYSRAIREASGANDQTPMTKRSSSPTRESVA